MFVWRLKKMQRKCLSILAVRFLGSCLWVHLRLVLLHSELGSNIVNSIHFHLDMSTIRIDWLLLLNRHSNLKILVDCRYFYIGYIKNLNMKRITRKSVEANNCINIDNEQCRYEYITNFCKCCSEMAGRLVKNFNLFN